MKKHLHYSFKVKPVDPGNDILIAELGALGFEAFEEHDDGIEAYISEEPKPKNIDDELFILNQPDFEISYKVKSIEPKNWNKEWESNFAPIEISDHCRVRAPFHQKKEVDFEIIINPKMAFGTGHHETTHLMLKLLLKENLSEKTVLDMGCGTGVLAILAEIKGAVNIEAIDIDDWSVQNTTENCKLNNCQRIQVFEGDVELVAGKKFHVILANINRNILLKDIAQYTEALSENGVLFVSGFYSKDLKQIKADAARNGLSLIHYQTKNDWVAAKFKLEI